MSLHICNPYFESELKGEVFSSLEGATLTHPILMQLQFLPLLYAAPEDGLIVSAKPNKNFFEESILSMPNSLHFPEDQISSYKKIIDWGASPLIAGWAKRKGISYSIPPFSLVKTISSKVFSFTRSPLPGARCINSRKELDQFKKNIGMPAVLKDCQERAGRGHFFLFPNHPINEKALEAFLARGYPFIAEPWVERIIDFSTQWEITEKREIHYLGITLCHNDAFGKYLTSEVGHPTFTADISFHRSLVEEIAQMGFFGNIGIDAMIYKMRGEKHVQPIVEVNPRKTMGYVALALQKRHFPGKHLLLSFTEKKGNNLLPFSVTTRKGLHVKFRKTVSLSYGSRKAED